jgi:septal ring factor EnvC (AmiA/AmiB activator)
MYSKNLPKKVNSMLHRLLLAGVVVIVIWLGLLSHPASSQQIDSRFNNLQADFNRVEARLRRVESQLGQLGRSPAPRTTLTPPQSNNARRNLSQQDQMFDNLATLVVELKQQVNTLEARVAQLESTR